MLKDFALFLKRGNVIDLAVGIVIGAAFGTVVASFVADVLMPPIGLLLGGVDFSNLFVVLRQGTEPAVTPEQAQQVGAVTLNYGRFVNTVIAFVIVAGAVYLLLRAVDRLRGPQGVPAEAPALRECPYCLSAIPVKATRCSQCTSEVSPPPLPPVEPRVPRTA
ncbi:large conductance mechanosensitive channel protein MscL [Myxococcota bacterium]|nr:large conductance mechanosensitive channel protein MscL [Myxococcota bacterium]